MNQQLSMKKERMKSMIIALVPTAEMLSFTSLAATYILVMSLYDIKKKMPHACHVT